MDGLVEFGAELTFETERGCASTTPTGTPDARTAAKLTLVVTAVHEQTPEDLFRLLDRVLADRTGLFESVAIDVNDAVSDARFAGMLDEYAAVADWESVLHVDSIDSYYDYDPARLLVTPERYVGACSSGIEATTDPMAMDTPADGAADTPTEVSESS